MSNYDILRLARLLFTVLDYLLLLTLLGPGLTSHLDPGLQLRQPCRQHLVFSQPGLAGPDQG